MLFISCSQRLVSTFGSDTVEWSGVCVCVSDGRAGSRRIQTLPVASQNPQIKRLEFFNFPKSHRMHPTTLPLLLLLTRVDVTSRYPETFQVPMWNFSQNLPPRTHPDGSEKPPTGGHIFPFLSSNPPHLPPHTHTHFSHPPQVDIQWR